MGSRAGHLVDQLHVVRPEPVQRRLYVFYLDADVVDALSALLEELGDARPPGGGLDQFDVALLHRQKRDLHLLVGHVCNFLQGETQGLLIYA